LSKELRRELLAELLSGDQPMSNRAIAVAVGVSESESTVRVDRAAGARNRAPGPEPEVAEAEVVDAEVLSEARSCEEPVEQVQRLGSVRRVKGADGKTYTAASRSKRPRAALSIAFIKAACDLDRAAQRLLRLTADDRFHTHAANFGGRGGIQRAADAIRTVLDALAGVENG
jgi:hypothetical protein